MSEEKVAKPRGKEGGRRAKFGTVQEQRQVTMPPFAWEYITAAAAAVGQSRGEYMMRAAVPEDVIRANSGSKGE